MNVLYRLWTMNVIAVASLAFSSPGQTEEGSQPDLSAGYRLAAAMGLQSQVKEGFVAAAEDATKTGRSTDAELECVKKEEMSFVNDVYATALSKALTPAELGIATDFFSSPAGKDYLQYSRDSERKSRGLPTSGGEMSNETYAALLKFMEKPAGKKLLQQRVYETSEVRSSLSSSVSSIIMKCKRAAAQK